MRRTKPGSAVLAILAGVLAAAFVVLPRPVASLVAGGHGGERHLTAEVSSAFVGYWRAGRDPLTPELTSLVEYWRWYHVVKAAAAIGLLVLLLVLAARIWRTYAGNGGGRRSVLLTALAASGVLSVGAFLLAMANVQGSVAPLSSLLSLLPVSRTRGDLAVVVGEVRQQAAHYPDGSSEALRRIVGDLATYHVVVAVTSWLSVVVLVVLLVRWWRTRAGTTTDAWASRPLRILLSGGVLVVASFLAVLGLANTTTALDSPTAVRNFYSGTF